MSVVNQFFCLDIDSKLRAAIQAVVSKRIIKYLNYGYTFKNIQIEVLERHQGKITKVNISSLHDRGGGGGSDGCGSGGGGGVGDGGGGGGNGDDTDF